jgi:hypothetical protein
MFDNPAFSREEKDKVVGQVKCEYRPHPVRWEFAAGGAQYVHRLVAAESAVTDFFTANALAGMDHIYSNSFKWGVKSDYGHYVYSSDNGKNDMYSRTEVYGNSKVAEFIKITAGGTAHWNRDYKPLSGWKPGGFLTVATAGFFPGSVEAGYRYDMLPFKPEEFYFQQNYIMPEFDLAPGVVHRGELKSDVNLVSRREGEEQLLRHVKLRISGFVERNNNFYNYYSRPENVISARGVAVNRVNGKWGFSFLIDKEKKFLEFDILYDYTRYWADETITYLPSHVLEGTMRVGYESWELEIIHKITGPVFTDPGSRDRLQGAVVGTANIQYKALDGVNAYVKLNNLYNNGYFYRDGYPEPGFMVLAGVRIFL